MQIIWAEHDGNRIEELLGVMLCREFKFANRIRPSQGDGGIDVMVPVGDGLVDIYQVKGFTASFTNSQKAQIKKSLKRINENPHVQVRDWYLVVPVNPTPQLRFDWFAPLVADYSFGCHWFGLDQCVGLAAKYPEVSRYYLGEGVHDLERALGDLRAITSLDISGALPGQAVALGDLHEPLARALEAVNRVDPHYRYEFMITKYMPFGLDAAPPAQPDGLDVAAVVSEQISDDAVITYLIIPRYVEAALDRPISGTFLIPADESGNPIEASAATFLEFGISAQFSVQQLTFDLPGGLSSSAAEGRVIVGPVAGSGSHSYDLRLVTVDAGGGTLAECVCRMQPVTTGVTDDPGVFGCGVSDENAFELEMPMRPQNGAVTLRFKINPLTGREPAAIASELWFLNSLSHAAQIRVGNRFGPLADGGIPVPEGQPAMIDERLLHLVDDMALVQRESAASLRLPDMEAGVGSADVKSIRIAATLLRGGRVRTTYIEHEFTLPEADRARLRESVGVPMTIEIIGAWHADILGAHVTIQPIDMGLRSAVIELDEERDVFIARPAPFSDEMLIQRHVESNIHPDT